MKVEIKKMKRMISVLLCILLICLCGFKGNTKDCSCQNCEIAQTGGETYVDINWHEENYYKSGRRATRNLYVDKYYQDDYQDVMSTCGLTIAEAGCALTSVTMVNNYLYGRSYTPSYINDVLGSSACPLNWQDAASELGMRLVYYNSSISYSSLESNAPGYINSGNPVIVGLYLSDGSTHYVVIKGYNSSSYTGYTFYINDPSSYNDYSSLDEYLDDGATVFQMVVYD